MADTSSLLRMAWAPRGGAATADEWWPPTARMASPALPAIGDIVQFGAGVALSQHHQIVEATWRGTSWQPSLEAPVVTVTVTPHDLQIIVPAVWRAHIYIGWRDGCLLVSSDLRTLAAALLALRPAPEGVAAFLASGQAGHGIRPSLYRGIWDVQPGYSALFRADAEMRCHRVWAPERYEEFAAQRLDVVTERLRVHLDELAERILRTHHRVACLFSGGLDSSLVAATLLRRAPQQVVLFNVGSSLGTAAEARLRARFLRDFDTVSHPVDLPTNAGLVQSLRATNAVAALPTGSPFAHVFEEIIAVARGHDCDAIVTGDGGDEVFAEREEVLVDLLARRSRMLPAAIGFFALRNRERGTQTLRRAIRHLRTLNEGALAADHRPDAGDVLLSEDLAQLVAMARNADAVQASASWAAGWTCSGLGSYRRAASVPEWEPISADAPDFPVVSPLVDATVVGDALTLRRDALVPRVFGGQPKWLLRQAALSWLSPVIALHPKIGSADGQILARMRSEEHDDLLNLLGSGTARSLGLSVPAAVESPDAPVWNTEGWIRAAALAAWFDQVIAVPRERPTITLAATVPEKASLESPVGEQHQPSRPARWRVAAVAALNLAAQLAPAARTRRKESAAGSAASSASDDVLAHALVDLARRACAVPFVSASSLAMCRALAWYLRLTGKHPVVVRGSAHNHWMTQYWIEVDGSIVDVSGTETPLVTDPGLTDR